MKTVKSYALIIMAFALISSGCSAQKSEKHLSSVEKAAIEPALNQTKEVDSAPVELASAPVATEKPVDQTTQGAAEKKETAAQSETKTSEAAPGEKPAEKKADAKPSNYDKLSIRDKVANAFSRDKSVLLYFYSDSVKDSKEDLHKIQEIAAANNAETVEVEALDEDSLRYSYSVEYVPTVYAIRPDSGMVARWMVDLPQKEIEASISDKSKPAPEQAIIGKAISSKKPQLLFFMAQWCGYCRKLAPEVEKFEKDYSDRIEVVTIDIDRIPYRMKDSYVIDGVPALFITDKNGILVKRTGYPEGYKNYVKYFESLGVDMKKKS